MRLKIGFILRSLLVVGSFLGLVVLWSSLSSRPDDPSPLSRMRVSDPPGPLRRLRPATCFVCARVWRERGAAGSRRGVGAAAPQVVLDQRRPKGAPSPTHRVPSGRSRPAPWPPLPPALPRPGLRRRHPSCGGGLGDALRVRTAGWDRRRAGSGGPRLLGVQLAGAANTAVAAEGRGVGPGCGLWRVQA